jgi:tRNA A37 threonylcarbamoyladenosine dehydratase
MKNIPDWMSRTQLLLGDERIEKLMKAHVLVVGLGGVGGNCAEALVRAGVGQLTIVDADIVEASNCNRQLVALQSTVGKLKTEVLQERLMDINPQLILNTKSVFLKEGITASILNACKYDYAVDCIDTLSSKVYFIKGCLDRGIPLISSMGAGRKFDPTRIKIVPIEQSIICPLAKDVRKYLHRMGIRKGFDVVFSDELFTKDTLKINPKGSPKRSFIGTNSYIPAIFGLMCASVVIRQLTGLNQPS